MSKRHKHADLIIAWAEGAEIEVQNSYGKWIKTIPSWNEGLVYRLKKKNLNGMKTYLRKVFYVG